MSQLAYVFRNAVWDITSVFGHQQWAADRAGGPAQLISTRGSGLDPRRPVLVLLGKYRSQ